MKISVLIPAYNCAATVREALNSVLNQTTPPDEILVMDDGSTDETLAVLGSYGERVTVMRQANQGVAASRNLLCAHAQGDLIAFIDSDDVWHPRYLEVQRALFQKYPQAIALIAGHVNCRGNGAYEWRGNPLEVPSKVEVILPPEFIRRYNWAPGPFMCMSHCCFPKAVLRTFDLEPFKLRIAEDTYFFNRIAPLGCIVYTPTVLVAYRVREGSLSSNRLAGTESEVRAFELLEDDYKKLADRSLRRLFNQAHALKRRQYAKVLLGAGKTLEARAHLRRSLTNSIHTVSWAKSLGLLALTYVSAALQPKWPAGCRELEDPDRMREHADTMRA